MSKNKILQVVETLNEGLKREYKIIISAEYIATQLDKRFDEIGKTAKMAGFRTGKVPSNIIRKRYGSSVIEEVLKKIVEKSSKRALTERELRPASQPEIDVSSYDEGQGLEYTIALEVFPDIPKIDLTTIELVRWFVEAGEDDINKGLGRVQKANHTFKKAENDDVQAKENDMIVIDFTGTVDGKEFEGGSANDVRLELGSGSFIDGFETQLIGSKTGDDVLVKVTFPEKYSNAELSSKDAEFAVKVKEVNHPVIPELNKEFAETMGFESLEKLTNAIKEQIEKDYKELSRSKVKKDLFDLLDKAYLFEVPSNMLNLEFDSLWKQIQDNKENDSELAGKTDEELKTEFRAMAERRVRLGILLAETGRINDIDVDQDALRQAVYEQARSFPDQAKEVIEFYQKNKEAMEQLKGPILEEKVVDFILDQVKIEDKPVSVKELLDYFAIPVDNEDT